MQKFEAFNSTCRRVRESTCGADWTSGIRLFMWAIDPVDGSTDYLEGPSRVHGPSSSASDLVPSENFDIEQGVRIAVIQGAGGGIVTVLRPVVIAEGDTANRFGRGAQRSQPRLPAPYEGGRTWLTTSFHSAPASHAKAWSETPV